MIQKVFCMFLAVSLGASLLIPPIAARATTGKTAGISLEKAILVAKEAHSDNRWLEEADFESSFYEQSGDLRWQLYWHEDEGSSLQVAVDAVESSILSYHFYENHEATDYAPLPEYDREQALAIAQKFIGNIAEKELADCRQEREDLPRPYLRERSWPLSYSFYFRRYAHDIPFAQDGLSITVNADNGIVTGYNRNWTPGTVPKPEQLIGETEAARLLEDAGEMELQYYLPPGERKELPDALLVYQASKINRLSINANTGEIYERSIGPWRSLDEGNAPMAADTGLGGKLSPAELKEITKLEGLLSKEAAILHARNTFGIADKFTAKTAQLTTTWESPEERRWHLQFTAEEELYISYRSVTMDAKTGEIWQYQQDMPDTDKEREGTISYDDAKALATNYIARLNQSKAEQTEFIAEQEPVHNDKPDIQPLTYSFYFRRLVNDIPCPQNGFHVTVYAGSEPQVISYSLNWSEREFPSPKKVLSRANALQALRESYPFKLEYRSSGELQPTLKEKPEKVQDSIALVYTQAQAPATMFAADSMAPIDHTGQLIKEETPKVPIDIAGHEAEEAITYLARAGIIQVGTSGKYRPNQVANIGDWLELLTAALGNNDPTMLTKLDSEDVNRTKALTREEMALYAVRALGYERIAAMQNIFTLKATDGDQVTQRLKGYVAIAYEFGLLGDDAELKPREYCQRGQLALLLMQMFRMEL